MWVELALQAREVLGRLVGLSGVGDGADTSLQVGSQLSKDGGIRSSAGSVFPQRSDRPQLFTDNPLCPAGPAEELPGLKRGPRRHPGVTKLKTLSVR